MIKVWVRVTRSFRATGVVMEALMKQRCRYGAECIGISHARWQQLELRMPRAQHHVPAEQGSERQKQFKGSVDARFVNSDFSRQSLSGTYFFCKPMYRAIVNNSRDAHHVCTII